jgi:hypothetical protein
VSVANWAIFDAGPGEAGQTVLAYLVSSISNPALFSAAPAVATDGTLTFAPAANASGSSTFQVRVRDSGGTANGGVDTSGAQTFTITVTAVNDAPVVTLGAIPTIVEDAGPQTVPGFASFNAGAPNESSQSLLGYTVGNISNPAMFAAGPAVSNSGTLTYTPSSNASGTVTFTVQARDSGGTTNGGIDTSLPVMATITITNVNDAPTFTASNPSSVEDAGTVTLTGWATFNPGPFEDGQAVLAYTVTNISNPGLFTAPPAVANDGTLTFATALNASGTSAFTVRVRDNGGTASGGVDTSAPQTFTLTVAAVNDAPVVTLSPIPTIEEDAGLQVVPGFAAFSPGGGPDEASQSVTEYIVSNLSNPASFVIPPTISNAGVLMYRPALDASGVITFTVQVRDNGGFAGGGQDLSAPVSAALTINGVNDPPVARARNVVIDNRVGCQPMSVPAWQLDDGSFDVDNPLAELIITTNHPAEFPIGVTPVRLTVRDPGGLTAYADATVTVLAIDSNRNGVPDSCDAIRGGAGPDCDGDGDTDESQCLWDNGSAAAINGITNGQLSQYGGNPAARVADDFYLSPGLVYRITSFRAQIVTNSIERGARLELFRDCDGSPVAEPFFTRETTDVASEVPDSEAGFTLVTYVFNLCEDKLVLDGDQTYWISIQGKVDCNVTDRAYWASVGVRPTPTTLIGSVPFKQFGEGEHPCTVSEFGPWESIADCCIGCVNMAYLFTGERCQLYWDNGAVDLGATTRGGDPSGINRATFARAADNIVIKPCREEEICFIEAWIWTNCDPVQGFLEVYDNQCAIPTGQPVHRATPTDVVPLNETVLIDGVRYNGYLLKFWNIPWRLVGNKNYWISVGADGTGSFNARSFFAYADSSNPCTACERRQITYGAVLPSRQADNRWFRSTHEYAFRIATRPFFLDPVAIAPGSLTNLCPPDVNRDGSATVQDIFDYMNAYFAGCP